MSSEAQQPAMGPDATWPEGTVERLGAIASRHVAAPEPRVGGRYEVDPTSFDARAAAADVLASYHAMKAAQTSSTRCPTCGVGIRFDGVDADEPPRLEAFLSRARVDEIARATTWFNGSHAMTDYYEFARLVAIEATVGRGER